MQRKDNENGNTKWKEERKDKEMNGLGKGRRVIEGDRNTK